jgi:hypothetical protein
VSSLLVYSLLAIDKYYKVFILGVFTSLFVSMLTSPNDFYLLDSAIFNSPKIFLDPIACRIHDYKEMGHTQIFQNNVFFSLSV